MRKNKKRILINISIILIIILIAILILSINKKPETSEEIAKCIAEKSTLYIQLGCHACETQENIFGDNYKYLDIVDCYYNTDECIQKNIQATPTWKINNKKYTGVKSINELKELTNCQ